jgi:hypothetical protein
MNQYLFLRRMRGPIMLLTFGITAILDEYAGISYSHSWPLYVIVWGLLKLAENAILAQNPPAPGMGFPGMGNSGYPSGQPGAGRWEPGAATYTGAVPGNSTSTTAIVPAEETPMPDEERR